MEFLAWPGWAGVGAIAQLLSLATIIAGVWRFVVQRNQMPRFLLTWDFIATTEIDGDAYHIVEFRNVGRGTGEFHGLHFANARPHPLEGFLAPQALAANDSFRLLITSPDLKQAWVRTLIRTPDNRFRLRIGWRPLIATGTLREQFDTDLDEWAARSYYEIIRDRLKPRPVAPGYAPRATLNGRRRLHTLSTILATPGRDDSWWMARAGTDDPPSLPFVPPPATPRANATAHPSAAGDPRLSTSPD